MSPTDILEFENQQLARNADPVTSHLAAAQLGQRAGVHRAKIMAELERGAGTFEEIAERANLRDSQVWRRLSDLHRLGFAEPTGEERMGKSGRYQRVWHVGPQWRRA